MKIPVIIFCGGQGTRMKEETEFRPKPMVTIGGKPILWHIMKTYSQFGFNDFIITLGYKGEFIKDYFLNEEYFYHDFSINTKTGKRVLHRNNTIVKDEFIVTLVNTGQETLTGERLLRVKKYIKSDIFMVTYGDGVANININKLYQFYKNVNTIGVITGVHPKSKWGLVVSDNKNIVRSFEQKPQLNQYVNGGFMVFNTKFFDYLRPKEMIEVGLNRLVEKMQLAVYNHDDYWAAMDTYQEVEELNSIWKKGNPPWRVW